jgi:Zn-dependent metalloprotease
MCKSNFNPLHCIIPPNVFEAMTKSEDKEVREIGITNMTAAAEARTTRIMTPPDLVSNVSHAKTGGKYREVYDLKTQHQSKLPGKLVRAEGDLSNGDVAVDEAYDFSGHTYDFYDQLFGRNSLDDQGLALISSVHVGLNYNNAFWNGRQMAYGDGDGKIFNSFTKSLDVVGHEFTHGVVSYTSRLAYQDEPGAINEHFADVFGSLIKQWVHQQDVKQANWLIGEDIIVQAPTRRAVRDMRNPGTAFVNDPDIGTDQQVDHISKKYTGSLDAGGVHWNSGIPNKAFTEAAIKVGGYAWKAIGKVWYEAMLSLSPFSGFQHLVNTTKNISAQRFGTSDPKYLAIEHGWKSVGL